MQGTVGARSFFGGWQKGGFPKRVVLPDVPPERKPERGYIRMFPRNENRNESTFACSPGTKTGTRAQAPTPPFYETALLSPSEFLHLMIWRQRRCTWGLLLTVRTEHQSACSQLRDLALAPMWLPGRHSQHHRLSPVSWKDLHCNAMECLRTGSLRIRRRR